MNGDPWRSIVRPLVEQQYPGPPSCRLATYIPLLPSPTTSAHVVGEPSGRQNALLCETASQSHISADCPDPHGLMEAKKHKGVGFLASCCFHSFW